VITLTVLCSGAVRGGVVGGRWASASIGRAITRQFGTAPLGGGMKAKSPTAPFRGGSWLRGELHWIPAIRPGRANEMDGHVVLYGSRGGLQQPC
jgi:hypothetical protein